MLILNIHDRVISIAAALDSCTAYHVSKANQLYLALLGLADERPSLVAYHLLAMSTLCCYCMQPGAGTGPNGSSNDLISIASAWKDEQLSSPSGGSAYTALGALGVA